MLAPMVMSLTLAYLIDMVGGHWAAAPRVSAASRRRPWFTHRATADPATAGNRTGMPARTKPRPRPRTGLAARVAAPGGRFLRLLATPLYRLGLLHALLVQRPL